MVKRLICACGCEKEFEPVNDRQIYFNVKCKNRALVRRWNARHKKDKPHPPGKPPGSVRYGRPKLEPTEAALPFERAAETTSDGPTKRAAA